MSKSTKQGARWAMGRCLLSAAALLEAFVGGRLMSAQSRRLLLRTSLGAMSVVLLALLAYAQQGQIFTWDGGGADNNWSTAGNWSSDQVPGGTGQAVLFTNDPVGQTKLAPNLSADVTIGQLQYSATASSYKITGSGTTAPILYISPAASYGGVGLTVASGAANQTITPEVYFLSTQSWDIGGTTTLTASGTIEDTASPDYGLTKNGTGTLVFPGDVRYDGPTIVNAGSVVLSYSNTSMLSAFTVNGGILRATTNINAMGNNATRNTITLAGGALELANDTGLTFGSTSRVTTVSGNTTIRSDRLTAGAGVTHTLGPLHIGAQTLSVTPGANDTSGTAGLTFGAITLSGNATFNVVNGGIAGAQLRLGAIGQSGGAQSLTKTGNGVLVLNGAANYTGSTTLSQGTITLGVANALGSGGFTFGGGTLNANDTTDSTIGALALTGDSTLNLSVGGTAATLTFAGVSGTANGILTITGWSGVAGGSGTNDKIIFSGGTPPNADFLQHIRFDMGGGNTYFGALGANGELIPSAGSTGVVVPNVVNLIQSAATTAITNASLVVGNITTAASATVAAGSVISQNPAAGVSVPIGSSVTLVVSSGPPPAPTCALTANPSSIVAGNSSNLSWTTSNATSLSIDQGIGAVTPVAAGSQSVSPVTTTAYTAMVAGPGGTNTCGATLTVNQAPAITSANAATFTEGVAASFSVTATGFPGPTFSEAGSLPSGVVFSSTGILSGTPAADMAGTYPILITAQNGVTPNATQSFTLTVLDAPPAQPPAGAYSLNASSGTTATDLSGNGNDGTLMNGVTWTTAGKYGNALSFDGNNGFVSVPDASTLDIGSSGTIEAWVKLNAINRWSGIIAKGNSDSDPLMNYALEVNGNNRLECFLGNGSTARTLTATSTVTTGTFYHVACVWNSSQLQLYINGTLNTSVTQNLTPAANSSPLYIGQYGGNQDRTSGVIDEVRIYGRALSQTEVQTDMNTAIAPSGLPPVISGLNPASAMQGTVTNVVVIGSNFLSGATCSFGSGVTVNSCSFGSATQLTANLAISAGATVGPRTVTVNNSDGQSGILTSGFTVSAAPPPLAPTLNNVSPIAGQQKQTLSITLAGANFISGAACSFGAGISVNSCTVNSATQITAGIAIASDAGTGLRNVTVTNPDGQAATLVSAFTVEAAPPPPAVNAAYSLNASSGTTATDLSGNGNDGTLMNGVTWTTAGKYGNALSFDGNNGFVSVPDASTLDIGSSGTIEAWVKLNAINRWSGIIAKGNSDSDPLMNYALEVNGNNRLECFLGNGSTARTLTATSTVTTGTFYHVACVWNSSQLQLYINGTLNTSVTQNLTPAANSSPLYIGQYGGNQDRTSGVIDEVRIYGRALSQTEVQTDMNTALAP